MIHRISSFLGVCALASMCFSSPLQAREENDHLSIKEEALTEAVAGKMAEYAMMSANAYHREGNIVFPLEKMGWKLEKQYADSHNGLAYDILKNEQGEYVFAFRGTDDNLDWIFGNGAIAEEVSQYAAADKQVAEFMKGHPKAKIMAFTGHSLGGGLALHVSAKQGKPAYVFDASNRVFFEHHTPAKAERILVSQSNEVNTNLRHASKDWKILIDVAYVHEPIFQECKEKDESLAHQVCSHSIELLALELLKEGKGANDRLAPVCSTVPDCAKAQSKQ